MLAEVSEAEPAERRASRRRKFLALGARGLG